MLIAGGGFTKGQFYGMSDSTGAEPARNALPLEDLLFTIYHQLGIDPHKTTFSDHAGRPHPLVDYQHQVMPELV